MKQSVSSLAWVKKATAADSSVAEASARADAASGTYQLEVREIAANWSAASSSKISVGDGESLAQQFGLNDGDKINFTITTNKGSVTIIKTDLSTVNLEEIIKEINQGGIGVRAMYDVALDRFFLRQEETGAKPPLRNSILPLGGIHYRRKQPAQTPVSGGGEQRWTRSVQA